MKGFMYILLIFIILQLFNCFICSAQPEDSIIFHPVVVPRPGSQWGGVLSGVQDKQGYMWFATYNGLYRYDGHRYISYFHDPNDSNSIEANYLDVVYADKKGYIWIGFWEAVHYREHRHL